MGLAVSDEVGSSGFPFFPFSKGVRGVLRSTVRLAEGLQRRERIIQKRTRRKTAREMRGNASIRTRITRGRQEEGR